MKYRLQTALFLNRTTDLARGANTVFISAQSLLFGISARKVRVGGLH
jgi:hypothetical protein